MKNLGLFLALFACLELETTVFRLPTLAPYAPNLVVFGVVMVGILRGPVMGMAFGALIGFVEDIPYASFLGETAFAYALIAYLSGYVRRLLLRESLLLAILLTGLGTELFTWGTYASARLFGEMSSGVHDVVAISSRASLLSMGAALILYMPFHKAFAIKPRVRYDDETKQG